MRTLATKQPTNDSAKEKKKGTRGRSRNSSSLSTGMPLLQRKCACGGGCPRCQEDLGMQTKLKIGEPGDKYEQEADRIAEQVMRMPDPLVQRQVERKEAIKTKQMPSKANSRTELINSQGSYQLNGRRKQHRTHDQADTTQGQMTTSAAANSASNTEQTSQFSASQTQKKIPESLLNGPFGSVEKAAEAFAKKYNPLSISKCEEICSIFVHYLVFIPSVPVSLFFYIKPWQHPDPANRRDSCTAFPPILPFNGNRPDNFAGEIHTHGCDDPDYESEEFSTADKKGCSLSGGPCFIVTPKGHIKRRR